MTTKTCRMCKQEQPLAAFPGKHQTRDGHGPYCKACNSAKRRAWRERNRGRANAQHAEYVRRNATKRREWTAAYRAANQDRLRQAGKEHRKTNPASHTQAEAKRRAAKRAAAVDDLAAVKRVYARAAAADVIPCEYCGRATVAGGRHIDHPTPLARGGPHAAENLSIACVPCNLRKGTRTATEFAEGV